MAKPGQQAAAEMARLAAMSRQAADLASGEAPAELREKLIPQIEGQLGLRCQGCGERIGVGFKFTRVGLSIEDGKPVADVTYLAACNGDAGCDFAARAREAATVVEMVEFVWLDEEEPSPADALRERAAESASG